MKRHELIAYLRSQGCELLREGGAAFVVAESSPQQAIGSPETYRDQQRPGQENLSRPRRSHDQVN